MGGEILHRLCMVDAVVLAVDQAHVVPYPAQLDRGPGDAQTDRNLGADRHKVKVVGQIVG